MQAPLILLFLCLAQEEEFDPSKYKGPAEAKSVELKPAALPVAPARAYLGLAQTAGFEEGGVLVGEVSADGPAAKAGVQANDRLLRLGGESIQDLGGLQRLLRARKPGDKVQVVLERGGEEKTVEVTLGPAPAGQGFLTVWTKPEFRLGLVLIEFADEKHNPAFARKDWEALLFSQGTYAQSPTGDRAYGSLADFYRENSSGRLTVRGRAFDWVALEKPRAFFEEKRIGDREGAKEFLPKAIARLQEREGAGCFDEVDGLVFLYAGRQSFQRPWMLWPHRASIKAGARTLPYYFAAEGGKYFNTINVHVHEFGHMLGLPDQYGQKHATGVGKWCTMAVGHMGAGESRTARPHHLCVICKERLGYVQVTAIDPREPQRLKLGAIESDGTQAFKLQIGNDLYYFENRQRVGFDAEIEGTGLLLWRVNRGGLFAGAGVDLIESHGRKVPNASLVETEEIPYPSFYNRHFTPATTPAAPEGLFVTDVAKKDGTVTFKIGFPKDVRTTPLERHADY